MFHSQIVKRNDAGSGGERNEKPDEANGNPNIPASCHGEKDADNNQSR
jgi:hypothetical protein